MLAETSRFRAGSTPECFLSLHACVPSPSSTPSAWRKVTAAGSVARRRGALLLAAVLPAVVLPVLLAVAAQAASSQVAPDREIAGSSPRKVIIDTDPGTDDAMAILLALNSPELDVQALTVVPGNVTAAQGLENALRLVSLAGRCDVPVAHGAEHPLNQKLVTAEFWHGRNGLANIELPPSKCTADPRFGPDLIVELVHKYPHEITLVPIGPETNIALAVSKDPSIVPLVRDVVIMGGSISGGNVNAAAEANIYGDPEAAQIVFNAGWPITMVGLDVGNKTLVTRAHIAQLERTHGPENDFVADVLKFLIDLSEKYGATGVQMYDPLAVGVAIDPGVVTTQAMRVDIETRGQFTRGETVGNRGGTVERNVPHEGRLWIEAVDPVAPNARVAVEVNPDRFLAMFLERIAGK
jgi:inosine-uridine nucleoside N-ribohydrolase